MPQDLGGFSQADLEELAEDVCEYPRAVPSLVTTLKRIQAALTPGAAAGVAAAPRVPARSRVATFLVVAQDADKGSNLAQSLLGRPVGATPRPERPTDDAQRVMLTRVRVGPSSSAGQARSPLARALALTGNVSEVRLIIVCPSVGDAAMDAAMERVKLFAGLEGPSEADLPQAIILFTSLSTPSFSAAVIKTIKRLRKCLGNELFHCSLVVVFSDAPSSAPRTKVDECRGLATKAIESAGCTLAGDAIFFVDSLMGTPSPNEERSREAQVCFIARSLGPSELHASPLCQLTVGCGAVVEACQLVRGAAGAAIL